MILAGLFSKAKWQGQRQSGKEGLDTHDEGQKGMVWDSDGQKKGRTNKRVGKIQREKNREGQEKW